MNKIVRVKNANYTTISNAFLRDSNISLKAKGLLAIIMSLPDDWDFSIGGIVTLLPEGKTAIYSAINELKSSGYCSMTSTRDERGRVLGNDYTFYEEPYSDKQNLGIPYQDYPHPENLNMDNQPQLNIDIIDDVCIDIDKDKQKKENPSLSISYAAIKDMWNSKCSMLTTVTTITSKRQDKIRARFKEFSTVGEPMEVFSTLLDKISKSKWMTEDSRENWRKGLFDWLFTNSENWVKVWEGKYDSQESLTLFEQSYQEQYEYDQYGNKIKKQIWQ